MINPEFLRESIKPGTSETLRNWIMFTNHYHNGNRTTEQTIAKFKGAVIGESIDFDKLEELMKPKPIQPEPTPEPVKPIITIRTEARSVIVQFSYDQVTELFSFLDQHKDEHPELHEVVYQAMTRELFSRF
jgi:hypothetical protein